jgi:hypothetical protein
MTGVKSTALFLTVNAGTYYTAPDAAPYVLGLTVVPWLAYLFASILLAVFGTIAYWFADREDPSAGKKFHEDFGKPK